jgi:hypothetical protein
MGKTTYEKKYVVLLIFIREVRGAISETDIDWFFPVLLGK